MKRVIIMAFVGATFVAAGMAQSSNEERFKAKFGRYSAAEEARQSAGQENTAYRAETLPVTAAAPWNEQWFKAKYGRYTPTEEARQNREQENSAFRAETLPVTPSTTWSEQWMKLKLGR
ncbi:MAG: hypothetical protein ABI759_16660 [Candidatus Solibacter sp.]